MTENLKIKLMDKIQCIPEWKWNSDDNGWTGYHIWCVDGGEAWIRNAGQVYHIIPGDIFLFDLRTNHQCSHNPDNPLCVSTVYFDTKWEQAGSKLVKQNDLFCQAIRHSVELSQNNEKRLAEQWIQATVEEIFRTEIPEKKISETIMRACKALDEAFPRVLTLQELSRSIGYSKSQTIRLFREELGVTPGQYVLKKKMEYAKGILLYSNIPVAEVGIRTGYEDVAYFSKTFKKFTGYSPGEYRKIGLGKE